MTIALQGFRTFLIYVASALDMSSAWHNAGRFSIRVIVDSLIVKVWSGYHSNFLCQNPFLHLLIFFTFVGALFATTDVKTDHVCKKWTTNVKETPICKKNSNQKILCFMLRFALVINSDFLTGKLFTFVENIFLHLWATGVFYICGKYFFTFVGGDFFTNVG